MSIAKSVWILSARFDSGFILSPAILISLLVLLFANQLESIKTLPPWLWLVLVVGVDAGHVYSTLFRTYLVKSELQRHHALLTLTPLLAWLGGCVLYSIDAIWFWRALAYLAVFHFIRQQYGFMMIYARHDPLNYRKLDKAVIYLATLYPLIYWHCRERQFNWFMEDDFLHIDSDALWQSAGVIYFVTFVIYSAKEVRLWRDYNIFNVPRNLLLLGTGLSWHVGIIAFDNDLIFTATNIIAHGVPYYALVWAYGFQQNRLAAKRKDYVIASIGKLFHRRFAAFYIFLLCLLAYLEEGLWDGLIWREHDGLFSLFELLPSIGTSSTLIWLVPLLSLPQTTHYVLDAFIWRLARNAEHDEWKKVLLR